MYRYIKFNKSVQTAIILLGWVICRQLSVGYSKTAKCKSAKVDLRGLVNEKQKLAINVWFIFFFIF